MSRSAAPHRRRPLRLAIFSLGLLWPLVSCSPLQPSVVETAAQKQRVIVEFAGPTAGKALLLKVFEVNSITGDERLETQFDGTIPADGKVPFELGYGPKMLYGQLSDAATGAVVARQVAPARIEIGQTALNLDLKGENRIDNFGLELQPKTVGDITKAKAYYDSHKDSPKELIDIGCTELCHSSIAEEADRVYPYFDSFPYEVKNPAYKDMAVLVARMIKDIKRNPRDPEVMPPGEGIESAEELKLFEDFARQLSQTVEAEKYPITRIELTWQVKNMPASGKITLGYDGDNTFSGKFTEPLFKSDIITGTLTAYAGKDKDKEQAIIKDALLPPTRINLRSQTVRPQVTIDKSKVVIVIDTKASIRR